MNFVVSVEFVSGKTGVWTPMLDEVVTKYPIHNIRRRFDSEHRSRFGSVHGVTDRYLKNNKLIGLLNSLFWMNLLRAFASIFERGRNRKLTHTWQKNISHVYPPCASERI